MGNISVWEILLLLLVVLLIFGPKKLPEMGRSLGRGMREFKNSITGLADMKEHDEAEADQPVTAATATRPARTASPQPASAPAEASAPLRPEATPE